MGSIYEKNATKSLYTSTLSYANLKLTLTTYIDVGEYSQIGYWIVNPFVDFN